METDIGIQSLSPRQGLTPTSTHPLIDKMVSQMASTRSCNLALTLATLIGMMKNINTESDTETVELLDKLVHSKGLCLCMMTTSVPEDKLTRAAWNDGSRIFRTWLEHRPKE